MFLAIRFVIPAFHSKLATALLESSFVVCYQLRKREFDSPPAGVQRVIDNFCFLDGKETVITANL